MLGEDPARRFASPQDSTHRLVGTPDLHGNPPCGFIERDRFLITELLGSCDDLTTLLIRDPRK